MIPYCTLGDTIRCSPQHFTMSDAKLKHAITIGIRMEFCSFAARHDADREDEERSP